MVLRTLVGDPKLLEDAGKMLREREAQRLRARRRQSALAGKKGTSSVTLGAGGGPGRGGLSKLSCSMSSSAVGSRRFAFGTRANSRVASGLNR